MKHTLYILPFLLLTACAAQEKVLSQRVATVDGNKLKITSGIIPRYGRFIRVENVEKQWHGPMKGGKEKWNARAALLNGLSTQEIRRICDDIFFHVISKPTYNMMDKDDTLGGAAPVLGIAASMTAHLAASAATDDANIPISVYSEFSCRKDERSR